MEQPEQVWHPEVIAPQVERTLEDLHDTGILAPFYLGGGTGLALHCGHRRSHDLDFFSREPVDPDQIVPRIQHLKAFSLVSKGPETLHATVRATKVSFLGYAYVVLFPLATFLGVHVADPRDIACMKISAIAGRGTRRDFLDLYLVSQDYGLRQVLEWFHQKFAPAHYSRIHVLKSLTYFEDAEKDPMPDLFVSLSWEQVKQFFYREVPALS